MDDSKLIRNRYMTDMILPEYTDEKTRETLHSLEDLKNAHRFPEALELASQLKNDITEGIDLDTYPLYFEDDFQRVLYEIRHPEYEHVEPDRPLFQILYTLGSLLIECDYPEAARDILKTAWDLAPYSPLAALEYIESLKTIKDLDTAEKAVIEGLKFTVDKSKIAHFFRDLGFINIERGNYDIAAFLYINSLEYEESPTAYHELKYIMDFNKKDSHPDKEAFIKYIDDNHITLTPELEILTDVYTRAFLDEELENSEDNN